MKKLHVRIPLTVVGVAFIGLCTIGFVGLVESGEVLTGFLVCLFLTGVTIQLLYRLWFGWGVDE